MIGQEEGWYIWPVGGATFVGNFQKFQYENSDHIP